LPAAPRRERDALGARAGGAEGKKRHSKANTTPQDKEKRFQIKLINRQNY
jgi:hypothetical protein